MRNYQYPKTCDKFFENEFLSAITHELKTPLNAIIGFSDVLREDIANPNLLADCLDYISEINRAAVEMNELINDLLDVGAIASGNFSVDLSRDVDVCDVLKRAMKINHDYALKRNVNLKLEIAEDVKFMKLDEKRMKQVLTNLISNAVKYSPKQSEVKIICRNLAPHPLLASVKHNPEFLEILVIDQGFGMNEDQVKTAFEKYQTIQNPNSGTVDSFGLGLPIAKHLVELQNGTIEVKSELNVGTEIKLKFPYLM
ncbi:MAG: HAMP domain-containing sensor histidine kinase [Pseudomonadota bacterium]